MPPAAAVSAPAPAPAPAPVAGPVPSTPSAPSLTPPATAGPPPIKVAFLLPLSGPNAELGAALLDAAQLALFDVVDKRLLLLPRDTAGTPEGARRAARAAVQEGAELVLGPLFSASVTAAAPVTRASGINMIALSTDRTVAGDGVFLMGFLPEEQIERIVGYARSRGLWRFAALIPDNAYGATVTAALEASARRFGGTVVRVEYYPDIGGDPRQAVQRLADYDRRRGALLRQRALLEKLEDEPSRQALERLSTLETLGDLDFDAVLLPDGGERLRTVALLLPYYDVDPKKVRLLGTGLWEDPTLGREPALVGGWFAGPPPSAAAGFAARFSEVFGYSPPRIASLAYDAVALAGLLAAESATDAKARFTTATITGSSGFLGTDGVFRFRADGLIERGLAIMQVRPSSVRVLQEAQKTFQ